MNVGCVVCLLFILLCKLENVSQQECNVTQSSEVEFYNIRDYSNVDCGCEKNCLRKCCLPGFLVTKVLYGNDSTIECVKAEYPFTVTFYDGREKIETRLLTNFSSGVPNCTLRQYSLSENIFPQTDNRIYIHTDPKMYFETSEICLEDYFDDNITTPIKIVIKCLAEDDPDFYFYCACMIVSCLFLLATFIVLISQPKKTLHTKALLFYIFNLFMAFITLLIIQLSPPFKGAFCVLVALLCLLFFITSIFWINVICLDIYLKFSGFFGLRSDKELERKRILWYTTYAVFTPIAFILLVFLINTFADVKKEFHPTIGHGSCFLRKGLPYLLYLHGPIGLLLIANITLFVLTALHIRKDKKATKVLRHAESSKSKADKDGFILYVTLVFAMGINWSLESIGWASEFYANAPKWLWYIPNTANMSYGVFIFFKFAWKKTWGDYLKERYYKLIGRKVANSKCLSVQTKSTTTSFNSVGSGETASSNIVEKPTASSHHEAGVDVASNDVKKQIPSSSNVENQTASFNNIENRTDPSNEKLNLDLPNNLKNEISNNTENQVMLTSNMEKHTAFSNDVKRQPGLSNQEANLDVSSNNMEDRINSPNQKTILDSSTNNEKETI